MSKPIRIDVEAVLASKAGNKARFVPRFLISYLKKIIHQDEMNGFLELYGDKRDYDFIGLSWDSSTTLLRLMAWRIFPRTVVVLLL